MSDLANRLKSAVPDPNRPDIDDLWTRGRAAARRRTVTRTLSGLAIVLLVTVTALRLTNPDDAAPVDVVTEIPDVVDPPLEVDDPPKEVEGADAVEVVVDGPVGSLVNLYPVDLPEGWEVSIQPIFLEVRFEAVTLKRDTVERDDAGFEAKTTVTFESGPLGEIRVTEEVDELGTNSQNWAGGGWAGRIFNSQSGTDPEADAALVSALVASGLLEDPDAAAPDGWRVTSDTRSFRRASQITVVTPNSAEIVIGATAMDAGSPGRLGAEETILGQIPFAEENGLALSVGDFIGWDGNGIIVLYDDGWVYEITLPTDLPDIDRQVFLDSLQPVTIVERSTLALFAQRGSGPGRDDHWHAAYGIYVCDAFLDPFDPPPDPPPIYGDADGVIHIEPGGSLPLLGAHATFTRFLDAVGWDFEAGNIAARDGSVRFEDGLCGETETRIVLSYRADMRRTTRPVFFEGDEMFETFFPTDGGIWILAILPADFVVPLLPGDRIAQLDLVAD